MLRTGFEALLICAVVSGAMAAQQDQGRMGTPSRLLRLRKLGFERRLGFQRWLRLRLWQLGFERWLGFQWRPWLRQLGLERRLGFEWWLGYGSCGSSGGYAYGSWGSSGGGAPAAVRAVAIAAVAG